MYAGILYTAFVVKQIYVIYIILLSISVFFVPIQSMKHTFQKSVQNC